MYGIEVYCYRYSSLSYTRIIEPFRISISVFVLYEYSSTTPIHTNTITKYIEVKKMNMENARCFLEPPSLVVIFGVCGKNYTHIRKQSENTIARYKTFQRLIVCNICFCTVFDEWSKGNLRKIEIYTKSEECFYVTNWT